MPRPLPPAVTADGRRRCGSQKPPGHSEAGGVQPAGPRRRGQIWPGSPRGLVPGRVWRSLGSAGHALQGDLRPRRPQERPPPCRSSFGHPAVSLHLCLSSCVTREVGCWPVPLRPCPTPEAPSRLLWESATSSASSDSSSDRALGVEREASPSRGRRGSGERACLVVRRVLGRA